mgnify:CR=1 FL=1
MTTPDDGPTLCALRLQVDYHLLGNAFESHDAEWAVCNPAGFSYGQGGKHMRADSSSSQLSSSPSPEFLNRYSTSSIAEDKAEVWVCFAPARLACPRLPSPGACPRFSSTRWRVSWCRVHRPA